MKQLIFQRIRGRVTADSLHHCSIEVRSQSRAWCMRVPVEANTYQDTVVQGSSIFSLVQACRWCGHFPGNVTKTPLSIRMLHSGKQHRWELNNLSFSSSQQKISTLRNNNQAVLFIEYEEGKPPRMVCCIEIGQTTPETCIIQELYKPDQSCMFGWEKTSREQVFPPELHFK